MGAARLAAFFGEQTPESAWARVRSGEMERPPPADRNGGTGVRVPWEAAARRYDVAASWEAMRANGIQVSFLGGAGFPTVLAADPEPPGVIFWVGDLAGALGRVRVAMIGTRHCTSYGRSVAAEIGRDLAESGVCVISGLALGIDGAAHEGALRAVAGAGPLGVAASGVDCPYPQAHTRLWRQVAAAGAVLSETPPGQPAQKWRFPARNRLIAALAQAVVVVESHSAGGSMLTVGAAIARGVEVLAVPGPVTSPSSVGTNQLLHEGVTPARHAGDVLAVLGDLRPWSSGPIVRRPRRPSLGDVTTAPPTADSSTSGAGQADLAAGTPSGSPRADVGTTAPEGRPPGGDRSASRSGRGRAQAKADGVRAEPGRRAVPLDLGTPVDPLAGLDPAGRRVLRAIDRTPTATSVVAERTGLPLGMLSVVLLDLESRGLVRGGGIWWERCAPS
ncbi:MAG TPA: DNA-processing protein DprA [Acidimicrobiales bacterium]|nr:DNA-processing protein DprA [Acidimicrobiales bacterium]